MDLSLAREEIVSLVYHDVFDYPLTFEELIKWRCSSDISSQTSVVSSKNGYYFLKGREGLILKRLLNERNSARKFEIVKRASKILSFIPSLEMLALTGAMAMANAKKESDIDIAIIAKKGTLWTTRIICYLLLGLFGFNVRRPRDKNEKDKLCLNMWLDESDMIIRKRNVYTAHELAQMTPLVNKDKTYERFINKNKWIKNYWPNAVRIEDKEKMNSHVLSLLSYFWFPVEKLAYKIQSLYMKPKITSEVISPTRAFFHPDDWGKKVLLQLSS